MQGANGKFWYFLMKKKDLSQIKNTPTLVTNNGTLILSQTLKKLDFLFKGHQISH